MKIMKFLFIFALVFAIINVSAIDEITDKKGVILDKTINASLLDDNDSDELNSDNNGDEKDDSHDRNKDIERIREHVRNFNREDFDNARKEIKKRRVEIQKVAGDIRESYRGEIDVLRQQYREDRVALAEEAAELLRELADEDITEDERTEIRAELKTLRDEHRVAKGAYIDEAKGIRVEYRDKLKEYLEGVETEVELSNGRKVEVKVMPEVAAERALERLRMKTCSEENGCEIDLKEVGNGERPRMAYSVKARRRGRFLGVFAMNMDVESEVDAETGDVIRTRKPWFAFLVREPIE